MNTLYKNTLFVLFIFLVTNSLEAQIRMVPFVGFGSQSIVYSSSEASVKGELGVSLGVDAFYYINEEMAIGSGVRMSTYKANAKLGAFSLEQSLVDKDGDSYVLNSSSNGIEEKHTISTIEIPVLFRYQKWINNNVLLFGATGPVIVLPGNTKSEYVSGNLITSGYYPAWNVSITDVDEYGYNTLDLKGEMSAVDSKVTLGWALEAGGELFLSKRMNLSVALYYQPGLSGVTNSSGENLMADAYTYNGSLKSASDVKLSKLGIKIGLSIDLTPNERGSIKSIR